MMYSPFYLALLGSATATAVVPNSVATALAQAHRKLQQIGTQSINGSEFTAFKAM